MVTLRRKNFLSFFKTTAGIFCATCAVIGYPCFTCILLGQLKLTPGGKISASLENQSAQIHGIFELLRSKGLLY